MRAISSSIVGVAGGGGWGGGSGCSALLQAALGAVTQ
jgi:hypothetical protein